MHAYAAFTPPGPALSVLRMSCMSSAPPPPPSRRRRLLRQLAGATLATAASYALHATPPKFPHQPCCASVITTALPRAATARKRPVSALPAPLSPEVEAQILLRMSVAVACGAIIGTERRAASANAGIRTLSLVSLGSAIFALTSLHGLGGDPSRMGAAISTGIGFLGSGAINGEIYGSQRQLVTAASIWIAAALGVAAASGLFSMALVGAIATVWILRWRLLHRYARKFVDGWVRELKVVLRVARGVRGNGKEGGDGVGDGGTIEEVENARVE